MKMCIVLILFVFCNMDANAQITNAIGGVADWIEFSPAFHEDNTEEPKKKKLMLDTAKQTLLSTFIRFLCNEQEQAVFFFLDEDSWIQTPDGENVHFSGFLQYNAKFPFTNKLEASGFSSLTNTFWDGISIPHPKGIISGELSGKLYVITADLNREKILVGTNGVMRICLGSDPRIPGFEGMKGVPR